MRISSEQPRHESVRLSSFALSSPRSLASRL